MLPAKMVALPKRLPPLRKHAMEPSFGPFSPPDQHVKASAAPLNWFIGRLLIKNVETGNIL